MSCSVRVRVLVRVLPEASTPCFVFRVAAACAHAAAAIPVRPTVDIVGPDLNRRPRPRQVQALCLGGPGRLSIHGAGIRQVQALCLGGPDRLSIHGAGIRQVQALCLGGPDRLSIHGAGIRQVQARPTAPALATVRLCPTTPDSDGHRLGWAATRMNSDSHNP